MRVTYLGHSGFLLETNFAYYLFDYIRGELPEFSVGKSLFVFASHSHGDHFDERLFRPELAAGVTRYYLSDDIRKKFRRAQPSWMGQHTEDIEWVTQGRVYSQHYSTVTTLQSNDLGVAFVVRETNGATIYHAGDLNWWHWEGEDLAWNRNMEVNYKREISRLQGWQFDAAFIPLDPRLEKAYGYGLQYFLETVGVKHVFPMHFWKDYSVISRYRREHPSWNLQGTVIHQIHQEGEQYEI